MCLSLKMEEQNTTGRQLHSDFFQSLIYIVFYKGLSTIRLFAC